MNKELVEKLAEHFLTEDPDTVGWANITEWYRKQLLGRAEGVLSSIEREGFKVVPVEPTEAMLVAWENAEMDDGIHTDHDHCRFAYRTLLSAAPKQG